MLSGLDGMVIDGVRIVAQTTPVSLAALLALVAAHRPVFVLALGLALAAPVIRIETLAVNACHFAIPDNDGARPAGGVPIDRHGPAARQASWDAAAVVAAILDEGIPARLSFHAGTHLCNLTLYAYLGALEALGLPGPCGFLHLPYLPEQVVWMMRQRAGIGGDAFNPILDLPSMDLGTQRRAVTAALRVLVGQARDRARAVPPDAEQALIR